MKKYSKSTNLFTFLPILAVAVFATFFVGGICVFAQTWVGPTADPPGNNVSGLIQNRNPIDNNPQAASIDISGQLRVGNKAEVDNLVMTNSGWITVVGGSICLGSTNPEDCISVWPGSGNESIWVLKDNNDIYYNAGNVGIGTSNPSADIRLIVGDGTPIGNIIGISGASSEYIGTRLDVLGAEKWFSGINNQEDYVIRKDSSSNPFLIDYDTSNVGIGTGVPDNKLTVNGDINIINGNKYRINNEIMVQADTSKKNYFFANAGNLTMTGDFNSVLGRNSLKNNVEGSGNVAFGEQALTNTISGNYNTALGFKSLFNHLSSFTNTAIGSLSGGNLINGNGNTFLGTYSGGNIEEGNYNTFVGYGSGGYLSNILKVGSNNILIGYNAGAIENISNFLNIGNTIYGDLSAKSVGIGVVSPSQKLDVGGSLKVAEDVYLENDKAVRVDGSGLTNLYIGNWGVGASGVNLNINNGGILAAGSNSWDGGTLGAGKRMMWIPAKSAFRAGMVEGDEWNSVNIGNYSFAVGFNTKASGGSSVAMGSKTTASGQSSLALGTDTMASGHWSMATGWGTQALGIMSTAMGEGSIALGDFSTAIGLHSRAGRYSVAIGKDTIASGQGSVAFGNTSEASGNYSVAIGSLTTASGQSSFALGSSIVASGGSSVAMGQRISVSGNNSFGIGLDYYSRELTQPNTMAVMGGKVGIGILNPVEVLEVNGNIKASGGYLAGSQQGLTKNITVKGSDGNNCSINVVGGIIVSTTCP